MDFMASGTLISALKVMVMIFRKQIFFYFLALVLFCGKQTNILAHGSKLLWDFMVEIPIQSQSCFLSSLSHFELLLMRRIINICKILKLQRYLCAACSYSAFLNGLWRIVFSLQMKFLITLANSHICGTFHKL